jgi:hypothetical protein
VRLDGKHRWTLTLGLGALAAIGVGTITGQQIVQELNPFYMNPAMSGGGTTEPEIVAASFTAPSDPPIETTDLSYGRGDTMTGRDGGGQIRY